MSEKAPSYYCYYMMCVDLCFVVGRESSSVRSSGMLLSTSTQFLLSTQVDPRLLAGVCLGLVLFPSFPCCSETGMEVSSEKGDKRMFESGNV